MPPSSRPRDPSRIPVRGAIGLGVTAAGMAFLLSLRPPVGGETTFAVEPADDTAATTTSTVLAASDPTAEPTASADPSPGASANADPSPGASVAASASPAASPDIAPTVTPEPAGLTGTATGDAVSFKFGTVQVEVTVENGVITAIAALQLPDEDRKSLAISNEVEPILQSEALQAQSADIDVISGATYTSLAYAQSLQSALDRLAA
jgi:uncharacterized protein with FMN-binding domain